MISFRIISVYVCNRVLSLEKFWTFSFYVSEVEFLNFLNLIAYSRITNSWRKSELGPVIFTFHLALGVLALFSSDREFTVYMPFFFKLSN